MAKINSWYQNQPIVTQGQVPCSPEGREGRKQRHKAGCAGVLVHSWNPNPGEAEAGGSPYIHSKTLWDLKPPAGSPKKPNQYKQKEEEGKERKVAELAIPRKGA